MPDWRTQSPQVEFRGVKFYLAANVLEGGRSAVVHSFPMSEDPPFVEDLGRRGHRLQVDGFLVGDDCLDQRDALIAALNRPGLGELRHPTLGVRRAVAEAWRTRESNPRGGLVELSIDFLETVEAPILPSGAAASAGPAVAAATGPARTTSLAALLRTYVSVPGHNSAVAGTLTALAGASNLVMGTSSALSQEAASVQRQAADLAAQAAHLAGSPADLAVSVSNLALSLGLALRSAVGGPNPVTALLRLAATPLGVAPVGTTSKWLQARANWDATNRLVKEALLFEAADAAANSSPRSVDEAIGTRTTVTDALDAYVLAAAVPDDVYSALMATRAALVQSVPGPDADLPRVVTVSVRVPTPSLVLAQRLYGDVSREADILAGNVVPNPLLVPGGVDLQVLSS